MTCKTDIFTIKYFCFFHVRVLFVILTLIDVYKTSQILKG